MRNQSSNKKSILALAFLLAFAGTTSTVIAGSTPAAAITTPTNNVSVKYMGVMNYMPVFQVNIENATQEKVFLTLKDEDNDILYTDSFKDKRFSKNFQFNVADPNNTTITLNLVSKGVSKTETFRITNATRTIESVAVTKIK